MQNNQECFAIRSFMIESLASLFQIMYLANISRVMYVSIGDTADDSDSMSGFCARNDWEAGSRRRHLRSLDIALVAWEVERAACDSYSLASDTTAAAACDDECLDEREVADSLRRDIAAGLDCSSSMDIRRDGECCWLEALLRCRGRRLTPEKEKLSQNFGIL